MLHIFKLLLAIPFTNAKLERMMNVACVNQLEKSIK